MRLTYEEFLEKYKDKWDYPYISKYGKEAYKQDKTKPRLSVTWTTGGASGGNCYNGDEPETDPVDPEKEPELEDLDAILTELCPGLTFLQYKKLGRHMKEEDDRSYEYYGNYYDKRTKYIEAFDLYGVLVEMKLIEEV